MPEQTKTPWHVRLAMRSLIRWSMRDGRSPLVVQVDREAIGTPQRVENLWRAYTAASTGGATTWASIIQVVIFSIAAGGVIASGIILALTSTVVQNDAGLSFWLCILLSGAWAAVVVLGGTYYLLTFGGMMRVGRHLKLIECRLLEADETIDRDTLFEHSRHVNRWTSIPGYGMAALAALVASVGPQLVFVEWWFPRAGAQSLMKIAFAIIAAEVFWLLGYGVAAYLVNRPAKCSGKHAGR